MLTRRGRRWEFGLFCEGLGKEKPILLRGSVEAGPSVGQRSRITALYCTSRPGWR